MDNKQLYSLEEMTHLELVKRMEQSVLEQTGIPLKFDFELTSDGNKDLYLHHYNFSLEDVSKLVSLGWFDADALEEAREKDSFDPFEWDEDYLGHTHMLFMFILEKTFGDGAKIISTEVTDEYVLLKVGIPA